MKRQVILWSLQHRIREPHINAVNPERDLRIVLKTVFKSLSQPNKGELYV